MCDIYLDTYIFGVPYCADSDNGNPSMKGGGFSTTNTQKFALGYGEDHCTNDVLGNTVYECSGSNCKLKEVTCRDAKNEEKYNLNDNVKISVTNDITCESGCKDGACIITQKPVFTCYEYNCINPDCSIEDINNPIPSDKNQYRKTKVISVNQNDPNKVKHGGLDYCTFGSLGTGSYVEGLPTYVRENYCNPNYIPGGVEFEEIKCENGCYDGACVEKVQVKIEVKDDNPQGSGGSVKLTYYTVAGSVQEHTITEQNPLTVYIQKGITITLEPFVNNGNEFGGWVETIAQTIKTEKAIGKKEYKVMVDTSITASFVKISSQPIQPPTTITQQQVINCLDIIRSMSNLNLESFLLLSPNEVRRYH